MKEKEKESFYNVCELVKLDRCEFRIMRFVFHQHARPICRRRREADRDLEYILSQVLPHFSLIFTYTYIHTY